MSDYIARLTAELAAHGVTAWRVERDHPHPRLCFTWNARPLFYVMPATPSDRRGADNAVSDLRRLLGVRRVVRKSGAPKRRRNRTAAPAVLTLTVAPDPWVQMRAALQARTTAAWADGVRLFLAGWGLSGGESPTVCAGWWEASAAGGMPDHGGLDNETR